MFITRALHLAALFSTILIPITIALNGNKRQSTTVEDYEYVVVGSGAGGGPLASRLALAGFKVLLIEAGDDQGSSLLEQVPAYHFLASEYEPMRWNYFVHHYADNTRQEKDSKMTWQTPAGDKYVGFEPPAGSTPLGIYYPRAGTLGGCSVHNAEITIYPHESDWANIATITGDDSWAPDLMRKYFERLENNHYFPSSVVGHGFNGWLGTSLTDLTLVLKDAKLLSLVTAAATAMGQGILGMLLNTVVGLGQVLIRDINADTPSRDSSEGLYQVPLSVLNGKRSSPRDLILQTANSVNEDGSRKYKLDIKLNTLVTRVRFDQNGAKPKAIGVDFLEGSSLYRADPRAASSGSTGTPGSVNATKEVILSAGAYNTPQLLKLSGIGPRAELEGFQIPVLVDLPGVGTNLQDRYETGVVGKTTSDFAVTTKCTFQTNPSTDPCLLQWETSTDKGVYASNGIAIAIVKKSSTADAADDPDIIITGVPAYFSGYFPGYSQAGIADRRHWSWLTLKAHTRNTAGTVKLRSADPRDTPLINFNYFDTGVTADGADDKDLEAVYEGMLFARKIFQDLIPLDGAFEEVWPGANVSSPSALKTFIQDEAWGHHASCSCPIGADDDPNAVLDSKFRLRGVQGLRVVDASVFPRIPGFYVALPVYMVAEKAADEVLGDA